MARQWAGARVDDLLDEIALGGDQPELQGEVLDLALAYNFATPYTAFLAIPESELDWQSAHTLSGARAYKADILRRKPDAARVARRDAPQGGAEQAEADTQEFHDLASPTAAPVSASRTMAENESPLSSSLDSEEASESPRMKKSQLGHGIQNKSGQEQGGCASCAWAVATTDARRARVRGPHRDRAFAVADQVRRSDRGARVAALRFPLPA